MLFWHLWRNHDPGGVAAGVATNFPGHYWIMGHIYINPEVARIRELFVQVSKHHVGATKQREADPGPGQFELASNVRFDNRGVTKGQSAARRTLVRRSMSSWLKMVSIGKLWSELIVAIQYKERNSRSWELIALPWRDSSTAFERTSQKSRRPLVSDGLVYQLGRT
jgi:hypothetical protein